MPTLETLGLTIAWNVSQLNESRQYHSEIKNIAYMHMCVLVV